MRSTCRCSRSFARWTGGRRCPPRSSNVRRHAPSRSRSSSWTSATCGAVFAGPPAVEPETGVLRNRRPAASHLRERRRRGRVRGRRVLERVGPDRRRRGSRGPLDGPRGVQVGVVRSARSLEAELDRKAETFPNPRGATLGRSYFVRREPTAKAGSERLLRAALMRRTEHSSKRQSSGEAAPERPARRRPSRQRRTTPCPRSSVPRAPRRIASPGYPLLPR